MSRPRARSSSTAARPRGRSWTEPLLSALLVLLALLLVGARGASVAPHVTLPAGPSLQAGSHAPLIDAAPRRIDVRVRRERAWLDLPPLPLASAPRAARRFRASERVRAPLGLGPGREPARDSVVRHFRRRIPRMNSEDPPCG